MSNDHYVPQHYLRAWANDLEQNKLFSYKLIEHQSKVHFKKDGSVKTSSSQKNLYQISDGQAFAEFETTLMTPEVDTPGSAIIKKVRSCGLGSLTAPERFQLASYIVILEARHPDTIRKMDISEDDLQRIFKEIDGSNGTSRQAMDDVKSFMLSIRPSLGTAASGMFAGWGHGQEAQALLSKGWIEIARTDKQGFFCSNYPVGSFEDYAAPNAAFTFPLSPSRALWCVPLEVKLKLEALNETKRKVAMDEACKMVDIFTLGKATEAYSLVADPNPFIQQHLGWMRRINSRQWSTYFKLMMEDSSYG